jgi:AmpD protein
VTGKGKSGKGKGKTGSPTAITADGLMARARYIPSPNCDERPAGCEIELLVVHHISLPPGEFGGPGIIELFTNRLDPAAHPYYAAVAGSNVSTHFLIRRDGELIQFVSCARRAWHAGESSWKGRARCNDFSIGIELEGTGATLFTGAQYARLVEVTRALAARYPIADIAGHSDIAPGRKSDPGPSFDWGRYRAMLKENSQGAKRAQKTRTNSRTAKASGRK